MDFGYGTLTAGTAVGWNGRADIPVSTKTNYSPVVQQGKKFETHNVSRLIPLKSCMISPISFTPNAVWTTFMSSWIAASTM